MKGMNGGSNVQRKRQQELELIERVARETRKSVITGPAALRWFGFSTLNWVDKVDLLLPGGSKAWGSQRQYPDRVYRSASLRPAEIQTIREVRSTTILRALFDSYRYHGRLEALVSLESVLWTRPDIDASALLTGLTTLPRAKGLAGFRELVGYAGVASQSPLETLVRDEILRAVADGRLTNVHSVEYQVQFWITEPNGKPRLAIVDMLINGFIAVEADGAVKTDGTYGAPEAVTREERYREKELQNLGVVVFRVTWEMVRERLLVGKLRSLLRNYPAPASPPRRAA